MENGKKTSTKSFVIFFVIIAVLMIPIYIAKISGINANTAAVTTSNQSSKSSSGKIDPNNIPPGMYEVGKDIPAGQYKLTVDSGKNDDIVEVSTNPNEMINSNKGTVWDDFSGQRYVTLSKGEYIEFSNSHAAKVN